jgi:hypothetical protein
MSARVSVEPIILNMEAAGISETFVAFIKLCSTLSSKSVISNYIHLEEDRMMQVNQVEPL